MSSPPPPILSAAPNALPPPPPPSPFPPLFPSLYLASDTWKVQAAGANDYGEFTMEGSAAPGASPDEYAVELFRQYTAGKKRSREAGSSSTAAATLAEFKTCSHCSILISTGFRYDSSGTPEDYRLCGECYHRHGSQHPHRFDRTDARVNRTQLTQQSNEARLRSIELHMQLLQHSSACVSANCPSVNCTKMKVHANLFLPARFCPH